MSPFLDPGSTIYDHPEKFGYRIFYKTIKDYQNALINTHWKNNLNYESKWMSRSQFVETSYRAFKKLVAIKQKTYKLPQALAQTMIAKTDQTLALLNDIETYENEELPSNIRKRIRQYNNRILMTATSQMSPLTQGTQNNQYDSIL